MLNGCDIYNIPSVPKFADLRRVGQGESANDSSSTMGDGNFDVRGVIASIASPSLRNPHSIAKEESIRGSNKEDEWAQKKQKDCDDCMFGLANLGMYRRAMSTDPALVRQSHEDGYRLVKPRTSRVGRSRERNIVPPNNQELEQRISVRRSERTVLHPARHDRVCSPSGDACTYSVEGNSGLAMIRYATPIVINTRTAAIQRRLQLADLAAYHGLQTSAHTMLVERTITSTADLNVVEQWEMEKKAQVVSKTEQKQKAVVHISSIHGRTELGFSQVVEGESKSTCAVGGEHIPRDRTRLNAPQQKGQVRMMRGVSTTPLNGLPSVRSERRFRESVTRRERGGDSLKRELNTERNQTRQIALKELRKPNPPTNLFLKEQKRVIDSTSGDHNRNRPQTKVAGRIHSSGHMGTSKTGHIGEKGPAQTFRHRPSSHLTEAEREALFRRLSTHRNVVAKNIACAAAGTPKKSSVETAAKPDEKRRSRSLVPGHPATRGLHGPVRRLRSNPGSRHSSRPGSAVDSGSADQQGSSGVEPQSAKTKVKASKPVSAMRRNEASHMKVAACKSSDGRGDANGRAEVWILRHNARKHW